jgi:hypothetical protein
MDATTNARRQAGLELQALAVEFERSDEAAFRRSRIISWVVTAVVALVAVILLIMGADWRYILGFAVIVIGLVWLGYWLSTRRQRQQTGRLKDLAARWLSAPVGKV